MGKSHKVFCEILFSGKKFTLKGESGVFNNFFSFFDFGKKAFPNTLENRNGRPKVASKGGPKAN